MTELTKFWSGPGLNVCIKCVFKNVVKHSVKSQMAYTPAQATKRVTVTRALQHLAEVFVRGAVQFILERVRNQTLKVSVIRTVGVLYYTKQSITHWLQDRLQWKSTQREHALPRLTVIFPLWNFSCLNYWLFLIRNFRSKFSRCTTYDMIRYDTRCYFNVRSKADISQLNLPHGTDN